jgi:D-alanyl-D-alanine carboxypeptidase
VAVTIDDPDDWDDHASLLEAGFSRYAVRKIVTKGQYVDTLEVAGGQGCHVEILADGDFSYALAQEEQPQLMLPGAGFVYAPAVEGAQAGFVYVLLEGKAIGKVPVVYGQTIEQLPEQVKPFWKRLFA